MGSNLAESDGHVGERCQRYYEERAKGGVGLIVVGVGAIAYPHGACNPNQIAISDDRFLPGLRRLTERLHAHEARVALQLQHAGKVATRDIVAGRPMWVPSMTRYQPGDLMSDLTQEELAAVTGDFRKPGAKMAFHEMTLEDVATMVGWFVDAADRARRAGFDAVELHAGHGYILSEFLSPHTNKRTDAYGGEVEGRARLLCEVIEEVRGRVGSDFPVWCRIDAKEFRTPGGITPEDAQRTAELAEAAGADAIHVTAYADPSSGVAFTDAPLVHRPCGFVDLAAEIKRRVSVPVIAVGRIDPESGDSIIGEGRADFVAMGRKLLADPELPNKLMESRVEDIRPCIYCYTCVGQIFLNQSVCCAVNPATGREAEFEIRPASAPRRVLVVGGGPAGMEAARVAALCGHEVTLCEKADRLGGTVVFASLVYEVNLELVTWLEGQIRKLPIDLRLGQAVTRELAEELAPDVILVAVGARRGVLSIPGADSKGVLTGDDLRALMTGSGSDAVRDKLSLVQRGMMGVGGLLGVSARPGLTRELTRTWMPVGKRVVIIGGGLVGVELAEFLCERGRQVSVLEEGPVCGVELAPPRRWRVLHSLREHGVQLLSGVQVEAIGDSAVEYRDGEGARRSVERDSVIVATGTRDNRALGEELGKLGAEVHLLGDCSGVGYIVGAMMDAARIARAI